MADSKASKAMQLAFNQNRRPNAPSASSDPKQAGESGLAGKMGALTKQTGSQLAKKALPKEAQLGVALATGKDIPKKVGEELGTRVGQGVAIAGGFSAPLEWFVGKVGGWAGGFLGKHWKWLVIAGVVGVALQLLIILAPIALAVYVVLFFTGNVPSPSPIP